MGSITATAFIAVRNGAAYVERCVRHLARNGVSSVITDNESDDGTRELLVQLHRDGHVVQWHTMPFACCFDLESQLAHKRHLVRECSSDWVLHLDIDEMPHSRRRGEPLVQALVRAESAGCNVLNFEEFVFLPVDAEYPRHADGYPPLRHYYFFAPQPVRLMRAWRRELEVSNEYDGGHTLRGGRIVLFSENMVLRHYPFLSQQHALRKYPERRYRQEELARGWHHNRVGLGAHRFLFPAPDELETLVDLSSTELDRSRPRRRHYWQWGEDA